MAGFKGVRACYRKKLGRYVYGCQIHINKRKHWAGQFNTAEEAARAYDYFAVHEYGDKKKDKDLNYPADRHRVNEFIPDGIRQVEMAKEMEHRLAEAQIARRNARPQDDPYVRHLLQNEPNLMSYQQFGASPFDGAGPSYGTGPSHGAGPTDDDITSLGIWAEEEEQQEEEWEKDWDSDSEQQRQKRQQERQQASEERQQQRHQEWQESEQQLLRMFGPPNPDAYHHNDPRHWVEVNRRDGIPPFRTLSGQPWGSEDTDDPADPMYWAQLDRPRDDDP